ncbi:restriction endonuclease subunit S [Flavobacterium sp. F-328]|uniref:Restriction endonuclease subunit S n=1 Tax=Flavobacterium erciyesense TaxID=2825842 RepID=A0ABS5D6T5_9FLAO|nr:restriction endonuclease subunit S [Flavobacterium erciyesense]MBQ0909749.1 restriction endonuclease subunit S [Flavobacterium erciyesense]
MREGWREVEIGDICIIKGGKRLPKGHDLQAGITSHPYIRARDIKEGKINFDQPVYINENTFSLIKNYTVNEGDIILTIAGTIGETAMVDDKFNGASLTENAVKLICNKELIFKLFLKYTFRTQSIYDNFINIASGSAQPKLGIYKIQKTKIQLPPLQTQRKIASILSSYDDLIENNLKRIKLLEEKAQLTYEEWFVKMRFPGYETAVFDDVTGLPEGWEKKTIGEFVTLSYGKALKADTRIEGIFNVYGSSGIVGTHERAIVKGPGVIVGRKGNVGSVFWEENDFFPIDTVYYVVSEISLYFIFFNLLSQTFVNNDAAVPGLNRSSAYLKQTFLPESNILKEFDHLVKPIFDLKQSLQSQNRLLKEARDILLPRLMSGMIDVDQLQMETIQTS